jgi:hypothetical protein
MALVVSSCSRLLGSTAPPNICVTVARLFSRFFLRRRRAMTAMRKSVNAMIAMPPTTPPAIAPTFGLLEDAAASAVGVDVPVSVAVSDVDEFVEDAMRSILLQEM